MFLPEPGKTVNLKFYKMIIDETLLILVWGAIALMAVYLFITRWNAWWYDKCPECNNYCKTKPLRYEFDTTSGSYHTSEWSKDKKNTRVRFKHYNEHYPVYTCQCGHDFNGPNCIRGSAQPINTGEEFAAKKCKNCGGSGKLTGKTSGGYNWDYSHYIDSQEVEIKCVRCDGKGWYRK